MLAVGFGLFKILAVVAKLVHLVHSVPSYLDQTQDQTWEASTLN